MELTDTLAARRSCRDFTEQPIAEDVLDAVLAAFRRGPTAGNTWGLDLLIIDRPADYWDVTLPAGPRRDRFRWQGLLRAPVLIVPVVDPSAYPARYAEDDKRATGLGQGVDAWPVPYWWFDAGAAVMAMLLTATDYGLGSLLFGQFGHEPAIRHRFNIPDGRRCVGTVALGHPGPQAFGGSRSRSRRRPDSAHIHHLGAW